MPSPEEVHAHASNALLSAALGGLLSLGSASCVLTGLDDPNGSSSQGATGAGGSTSNTVSSTASSASTTAAASGAGGASTTSGTTTSGASTSAATTSAASSGAGGAPPNPHTPIPDTACPTGIDPNPMVTSNMTVALTKDEFMAMCDQAGGIFEVQPLCGGSNACRGIAYDTATQHLTEHTCQGTNTCAGYNCVICT